MHLERVLGLVVAQRDPAEGPRGREGCGKAAREVKGQGEQSEGGASRHRVFRAIHSSGGSARPTCDRLGIDPDIPKGRGEDGCLGQGAGPQVHVVRGPEQVDAP